MGVVRGEKTASRDSRNERPPAEHLGVWVLSRYGDCIRWARQNVVYKSYDAGDKM